MLIYIIECTGSLGDQCHHGVKFLNYFIFFLLSGIFVEWWVSSNFRKEGQYSDIDLTISVLCIVVVVVDP